LELEDLSNCDPIIKMGDLWSNQKFNMRVNPTTGKRDTPLDDDLPATPCGLVAKSIFNDTFKLYKENSGSQERTQINIIQKGIAWSSDMTYKFKNVELPANAGKSWEDVQWLDIQDGKFNFNNLFLQSISSSG
jgi:hypothetical protein